jgi:hypothetical protein
VAILITEKVEDRPASSLKHAAALNARDHDRTGNLCCMPQLRLSTGLTVESQDIRHAEYYPSGSLRSDSFLTGVVARHQQHFLCILLRGSVAHVRGDAAAEDALNLERAGISVYRRRVSCAS